MSTKSISKTEFERVEATALSCIGPWFLYSLMITGLALTALGALSLAIRLLHLRLDPYPWGFLTKIPLDQSIIMLSLGIPGAIFAIYKITLGRPKLDMNLAIQNIRKLIPQLNGKETKFYYYSDSETITPHKRWWEPKNRKTNLTFWRTQDGSYYAKTPDVIGEGKAKKASLARKITDDSVKQVRTVEHEPPTNDELAIYAHEAIRTSPHVVHCIDVLENSNEKRSLILENCTGGTLEKSGIKDTDQLLDLYEDYLRGLDALERAGYLHLDLHAGNLFIDGTGRGRVGDFGSSRSLKSLNTAKGFAAMMPREDLTLPLPMAYELLSPEIALHIGQHYFKDQKDLPPITGKADVWALGIGLAQRLAPNSSAYLNYKATQTYLQPNTDKFDYESNKKIRFCPFGLRQGQHRAYSSLNPTRAPKNSESVDYLVWKMLRPDPNDRFSALEAADYISDLRKKPKAS